MMDAAQPLMHEEPRSGLVHRYLDPATSLAEVLFGLIMTLTFTLGAGIVIEDEGQEGVRQLLIAVVGCNVAWGIIDGALYILNQLFTRGRIRRLARSVLGAADERSAMRVVAEELDGFFGEMAQDTERDTLYLRVANHLRSKTMTPNGIRKDDLLGAFTSFWLVVLTSVPAAIPFLLLDNARVALRASNAILLALLFITGWLFARFTLGKPWVVGLSFLVGGGVLVALAIALGG